MNLVTIHPLSRPVPGVTTATYINLAADIPSQVFALSPKQRACPYVYLHNFGVLPDTADPRIFERWLYHGGRTETHIERFKEAAYLLDLEDPVWLLNFENYLSPLHVPVDDLLKDDARAIMADGIGCRPADLSAIRDPQSKDYWPLMNKLAEWMGRGDADRYRKAFHGYAVANCYEADWRPGFIGIHGHPQARIMLGTVNGPSGQIRLDDQRVWRLFGETARVAHAADLAIEQASHGGYVWVGPGVIGKSGAYETPYEHRQANRCVADAIMVNKYAQGVVLWKPNLPKNATAAQRAALEVEMIALAEIVKEAAEAAGRGIE